MTTPYKICPQCQAPAALDVAYCGRCGRHYRTRFAPESQMAGTPSALPAAPAPGYPRHRPILDRTAVLTYVAIAMLACIAVLAVRAILASRTGPPRSTPVAMAPQAEPAPQATPASTDPVTLEAQRAVENASRKLGLPPPGTVDTNGRVHLRSGGTISKEDWEAARRKVQQDPVLSGPPSVPRL